MKILDIKAMRGPNIWSNTRYFLIQMRLDLEEMEQLVNADIEIDQQRRNSVAHNNSMSTNNNNNSISISQ